MGTSCLTSFGFIHTSSRHPEASDTIRRAIIVLPFVSMVVEKTKHLQNIVAPYNRGRPRKWKIKARCVQQWQKHLHQIS